MSHNNDGSALIVVDVQNDFCPGGALAVPQGDRVIEPVNRLCGTFRNVVLTQDWHPVDHVSFVSTWPGRGLYDSIDVDGRAQILWPAHCIQGSRGADFAAGLAVESASLILRKGRRTRLDSYSALFENDHETPTGLDGLLRTLGLDELWICGLATDYCVLYTAQDAIRLGYRVKLVEDAVRGVDQPAGSLDAALDTMRRLGVGFVHSSTRG